MIYLVNKIKKSLCDFFSYRKRQLNKFIKVYGYSQPVVDFWSEFEDGDILRHYYWTVDNSNIKFEKAKICIFEAPEYWENKNVWSLGNFTGGDEDAICYDVERKAICIYNQYGVCRYTTINLEAFLSQLQWRNI